jgi:hypothetical protein
VNHPRFLKIFLACGLISTGCAGMHGDSKDQDGDAGEVKINYDDAPAAVKATLEAQLPGAVIDTVDKETEKRRDDLRSRRDARCEKLGSESQSGREAHQQEVG